MLIGGYVYAVIKEPIAVKTKQKKQNIKFSVIRLKKPEPKKIVEKILPKPKPKKIVEKILPKPKPKKIVKKILPKPKPKKIVEKIPKNTIAEDKLAKIKNLQNKYFAKVKSIIDKQKLYPKAARRRAIEGKVDVKFLVSPDGKLLKLDILKGKKIFHSSVKKAIQNSFPITPTEQIFKKIFTLKIAIIYRLKKS